MQIIVQGDGNDAYFFIIFLMKKRLGVLVVLADGGNRQPRCSAASVWGSAKL